MLKNLLKEIIGIIVGKQAEDIVDILDGEKYVNEFLIAKRLNLTINQTRNILYKLSDSGLVSSIRKKDKRKGWFTYFWKFEILKSLEFLKNGTEKKVEQTNQQIASRETKIFYVCANCDIEFNEENALLRDFTCGECGNVFLVKDNSKFLRELKKNLERYKKEIELIDSEINKEKEKIGKKREKEFKKEQKIKKEIRAKQKISRNIKMKPKEIKVKPKNAKKKIHSKKSKKSGKSAKKKILKKKKR
ncbi:MAG: hypothetical protein AABX28_02855 [Nanoarchaeota archaeon]